MINIAKFSSQKTWLLSMAATISCFLKGWRKNCGARLWRISLRPDLRTDFANCPPCHEDPEADAQEEEATLEAFSAYDFPSVEALVTYFHAVAGYPVRDTWLKAIKASNYDSWPVALSSG